MSAPFRYPTRAGVALAMAWAVAGSAARPAAAQMPSISAAKAAAHHAVDATNAHTAAMQEPTTTRDTPVSVSPATASAPSAAASSTSPASSGAASRTAAPTPATVAPIAGDSGGRTISVTERGIKGEMSLNREVFGYDRAGRRDPFASLIRTGELRPMLSDLRLVTVLFDPTGRNSIAVMHDATTAGRDQYRVRVGQMLGRMRVAEIGPKQVVFTIQEIGYNRQAVLALGDSTQARTQ